MAHDADHMIAGRKLAFLRRRNHAAEQLVAEDQAIVTVRRRAVFAGDDLPIGAAYPERERFHQQRAVRRGRLRHIDQPDRIRGCGKDRDRAQGEGL